MKKGLAILFFISAAFFFVFAAGCTSGETAPADAKTSNESLDSLMQTSLSVLQGDAFCGIDALFSDAKKCAVYAGKITNGNSFETENNSELLLKMSDIVSENKCVLAITYIGNDGVLKEIFPESEGLSPGDSLLYQDSVVYMNENRAPYLTDLFELKQGGYAAAVYYPVFSGDNYKGFISVAFKPEILFSKSALSLKEKSGLEAMVLQTDGVILYDPDETETGTPTFNNSAYADFPGIVQAAEKIVKGWSGSCEYTYYSTGTKSAVKKRLYWTTVAAGENEWKIAVIMDIPGDLA